VWAMTNGCMDDESIGIFRLLDTAVAVTLFNVLTFTNNYQYYLQLLLILVTKIQMLISELVG